MMNRHEGRNHGTSSFFSPQPTSNATEEDVVGVFDENGYKDGNWIANSTNTLGIRHLELAKS
jgi:hypothetical protein